MHTYTKGDARFNERISWLLYSYDERRKGGDKAFVIVKAKKFSRRNDRGSQ